MLYALSSGMGQYGVLLLLVYRLFRYKRENMRIFTLICSFWLWEVFPVDADLYQWTDADGVIHVVDDAGEIPDAYRDNLQVYRATIPATAAPSPDTLLAPSRVYATNSQGAFAQKLALDLGLIKHRGEDALSPLTGVGIQPAGSWRVSEPLTSESLYEILAAARRAADAQRLPLSADGAEAVVRQAAAPFLPPPLVAPPSSPPEEYEEPDYNEGPEVVVIEQPPQVIEVIREPYYLPPVIVGVPRFPHRHHRRHRHKPEPNPAPPLASPTGPHTTRPGPTHLPPRATHLPPRATHLPPGLSHPSPFGRR